MDFDQIQEALAPYPELESPSFIQGMLIGLICGDNDIEESVWIKKLLEEAQAKSVKESFLRALDEMFQSTNKGLNGSGFELTLCLPEDNETVAVRALMLGQLCEGFIYGLGLIGRGGEQDKLSRDVQEILSDFGSIAQIDVEGLAKDETSAEAEEDDLMQLVEFVRVGMLMVNEELNPTQAPPIMDEADTPSTLH